MRMFTTHRKNLANNIVALHYIIDFRVYNDFGSVTKFKPICVVCVLVTELYNSANYLFHVDVFDY